jgi:hypothetical protein
MSNKKQTAVEYLHKEYMKVFGELEVNTVQFYDLNNALENSKAMEKEQNEDIWMEAVVWTIDAKCIISEENTIQAFEQYYKETYETNNP